MSSSKTNKQTKQLRKKIMLSLMAAGVIGTVTLGASGIVEAKDIVAGGVATQYGATDISADTAIIGGWSFSGDNNRDMDHSEDTTSVTMNDGTARMIVGGSQIMNSNDPGGTIDVGTTNVVINKGTVKGLSKTGGPTGAVIGGNYIVADDTWRGSMFANTNVKGVTNVTINGGTFEAPIIAGSVAQNLGEAVKEGKRIVAYNDKTNLTIKGGAYPEIYNPKYIYKIDEDGFEDIEYSYTGNAIYAGGAAMGSGAEADVKNAVVTLDGLNQNVDLENPGEDEFRGYVEVYGGGLSHAGGSTSVENVTINVINAKNIAINAGGSAVSVPYTVPDTEDPTKEMLIPHADFKNADDLASNTYAHVGTATINIHNGQIWNLWLAGEGWNEYMGEQGPGLTSVVDNTVVNYYGGMIGEINAPGAKNTVLNLENNLELDVPQVGKENKNYVPKISFSGEFNKRISEYDESGNPVYSVPKISEFIINAKHHDIGGSITVNADREENEQWDNYAEMVINDANTISGNITVNRDGHLFLNKTNTIKGDIFANGNSSIEGYEVGTVDGNLIAEKNASINFNHINEIKGGVYGEGHIGLRGDLNLNENNIFDGDWTFLYGGKITGTYNLQKDLHVTSSRSALTTVVNVKDFEKNMIGAGKLILWHGGAIATDSTQLFGNDANDTTIRVSGAKQLPEHIRDVVDNKIDFQGGSVIINTDNFTEEYARAAVKAIREADGGNETRLDIRGNLLEDNLTIDKIDSMTSAGIDTTHDKREVAIKDKANLIVLGENTIDLIKSDIVDVSDSKVVKNGFSVGKLDLKKGSKGFYITGTQQVILGGSEGGDVLSVDGQSSKNVKVVVGSKELDANWTGMGRLVIGNEYVDNRTAMTLNSDVDVNMGSQFIINGKTDVKGTVRVGEEARTSSSGDVAISKVILGRDSHLDTSRGVLRTNIEVNVDSELSQNEEKVYYAPVISGNVTADSFIVSGKNPQNTVVIIGSEEDDANVKFSNVVLNGATLILDPEWDENPAHVVVDFKKSNVEADNYIDGKLLVGQNTYATIGKDDLAEQMFEKTGLEFGPNGIKGVLYIQGNQELGDKGAVYLDGSQNDDALQSAAEQIKPGTFTAAAGSVTIVDGKAIETNKGVEGKAALSGVREANIADGAKLYIEDAQPDKQYTILSNDGEKTVEGLKDAGWLKDDGTMTLDSNKKLVALTGEMDENGNLVIVSDYKDVRSEFDTVMPDVINAALKYDTSNNIYKLIDTITDDKMGKVSKEEMTDALNGVANMVALSGASYATFAASNMLADSVADHMSLANALTHDKDVWAKVIHSKDTVSDADLGKMQGNYDSKYNGIVVGADFYHHNDLTVGAAFSYVDGDVSGHTLATSTKDDAKYYGLSLYGGLEKGDYALLGDVSYLRGSHDVTQHVAGEALTSSFDTDAFSVGVRGEKRISYGESKFVPYAGARYVHLNTDDSTNSVGLSYSQSGQNLFLIPVGVKYSADYKQGTWTIRPVAELGYVWNTGDRSVDQTVSLDGTANGFSYDVTDSGSFIGKVGIEATNGTITYGLDYEYQKGDTVKSNRYGGHINFKF